MFFFHLKIQTKHIVYLNYNNLLKSLFFSSIMLAIKSKAKNEMITRKVKISSCISKTMEKFKNYWLLIYGYLLICFSNIEAKLIDLNLLSKDILQSKASLIFRSSYFTRNEKKIIFSNLFLGILQGVIDLIQLVSLDDEENLNLLIFLLNVFITFFSCILQAKLSNKLLVFILTNFSRVILDVSLRYNLSFINEQSDNDGNETPYGLFYLNQDIILFLLINSHIISNVYIKKFVWLAIQFLILLTVAISIKNLGFMILKAFIYTYSHLILANLIINFEVGSYKEIYELNIDTNEEKVEIEKILNIISNGILVLDFDLGQVLFSNKKLFQIFKMLEIEKFMKNPESLNVKELLDILGRKISKINEIILIEKEEKTNKNTFSPTNNPKKSKENLLGRDYYFNTYSKFQDIFTNLKVNFDYMHKRNMTQNLSAKCNQKNIHMIIKPTIYKQKKAFFLIFDQEFEFQEFPSEMPNEEKPKTSTSDNQDHKKIALKFLFNTIHKLKIPLSMITSSFDLIEEKEVNFPFLNSLICALDFQDVCLQNILDFLIFYPENIKIQTKQISFKKLFDELSQNFAYFAELKDISFTTHFDEKLPPYLRTDEKKLKQIIYILIDNALKYSTNGGVIKLVASYKPSLKKVKFSVHDTGAGISLENLTKLKKRLMNPDLKQMIEKEKNHNIGLCLCQNYLLLLNSSEPCGLRVKSKVDEFSVFSFFLDIDIEQPIPQNKKSNLSPILVKNSQEPNEFVLPKNIEKYNTDLVIGINNVIKIQDYKVSDELQKTITKLQEKSGKSFSTKNFSDLKLEECDVNQQVEFTADLDDKMLKYSSSENPKVLLPKKKILNEFALNVIEQKDENEEDESDPEDYFLKENIIQINDCEDVLIINKNYFHLIPLEVLLNGNKWKFVKYFDIIKALKIIAAKNEKNSFLFKVIFLEIGISLEENLLNLKILKKGFQNKNIPYIPIIGYSSLPNKFYKDTLIQKGMCDIFYLPIKKENFTEKISKWIIR